MIHLGVKVAEPLIVVAKAAIPFVEQVLVYAAFFKDGNDAFDAVRADGCSLNQHFDNGAPVGGKDEVYFLPRGIVLFRDDLDLGLQPLLAPVVLEQAGESATAGIVVHMGADSQTRVMAELRHAHSRVAGDLDLTHPGLRSGNRLKDDIDELLIGVRRERGGDLRLVESVFGHRLAHLLERVGELGLGKARAGLEPAGALQLSIQGGPFGAVNSHSADKGAGTATKDEVDDVLVGQYRGLCAFHLYRLVKAAGIELAQALSYVFRIEGLSSKLGQLASQRVKAIRGNAGEGNAAHRQATPLRKGSGDGLGRSLGAQLDCGAWRKQETEDKRACEPDPTRSRSRPSHSGPDQLRIAALQCRLSPQDDISQKSAVHRPRFARKCGLDARNHTVMAAVILCRRSTSLRIFPFPLILARTGAVRRRRPVTRGIPPKEAHAPFPVNRPDERKHVT